MEMSDEPLCDLISSSTWGSASAYECGIINIFPKQFLSIV